MSATIEISPVPAPSHAGATASSGTSERGTNDARTGRLPFAFAIFVSAFLLFQVQLLMGREVLPLFGGAAAVWTVCVFVFQLLFLAGYAYSHAITQWFALRKQVMVHGAFLGASAIYLGVMAYLRSAPIAVGTDWRPPPGRRPTLARVGILLPP